MTFDAHTGDSVAVSPNDPAREIDKLAAEAADLRMMFGAMRDVVLVLDRDGRYLKIAPTNPALLIRPPSELIGRLIGDVSPPDQAALALDCIRKALDTGIAQTIQYRLPIGDNTVCFAGEIVPLPDGTVLWSARDVSELKKFEEALSRSYDLLNEVVEGTSDAIHMKDLKGRYVMVNSAEARLYGRTIEEMIGLTDYDLDDEHSARAITNRDLRVVTSGEPSTYEQSLTLRGQKVWFSTLKQPRRNATGEIIGLIGISRDVTQRRTAEDAMVRLAAIVESSDDAIAGASLDGLVTTWNPAAERLLGYSAAEIIGKPIMLTIPPESRDGLAETFKRILKGQHVEHPQAVRVHKDGSRVNVSITIVPIRSSTGEILGAAGFTRDISAKLRLEEQLRQAQKMDAVGRLAGGIAHDFNNLLAAIKVHCELLTDQLDTDCAARTDAEEISKAADRAATLTRQLLAFSRKQVLQPKILDVNQIVREMERMLSRLIGENITLTTELAPNLNLVKADPGQIEQVIMNLAVNSRDAMPAGGRVTIQTSNVRVDEVNSRQHPELTAGSYALLTVTDTGTGMDFPTQGLIFEPFFTTKDPGKGTGLGLSTVYGIVKQSGGHISVQSELGVGTTFNIYLPLVAGAPAAVVKTKPSANLPCGTETVLVVEDEESVRFSIRRILTKCGYTAIEAVNGEEALRKFAELPESIDLVISDLLMPKMGGRELVERLTVLKPDLKVIFMSGYAEDAIAHDGVLANGAAFIGKPFSLLTFATTVRDKLDQALATSARL
ncbi:MAG: PAS domain-containing protein [Anaerolineae bacterium]|nr:PAS domain-containing protein [Gemmatimonadaceae bacterium]